MLIDRKVLRHSHAASVLSQCKATAPGVAPNDPGELTGYLAVFGNVDQYGEIIAPGAFKRSLGLKLGNGKTLPLMSTHMAFGGRTRDVIGSIDSAVEDDYGLKIHAVFSSDATSQETRIKVNEGHIKGLSVGYKTVRYSVREAENDAEREILGKCGRDSILILEELELEEGTVTPFPVNEEAMVIESKSIPSTCPHCNKPTPQSTATPSAPALDSTAKAPAATAPADGKSAPVLTVPSNAARRDRELTLLFAE